MYNIVKPIVFSLFSAVIISACSYSGPVKSGDLVIEVDDNMQVTLTSGLAENPLVEAPTPFSDLLVEGTELNYVKTSSTRSSVNDDFGKGTSYIIEGDAESGDVHIRKTLQFVVYDEFPSFVVSKVSYTNLSGTPVAVKGWTTEEFSVIGGEGEPALWSFQGQSTAERADWLIPIGGDSFYHALADCDTVEHLMERILATPMDKTDPDQWEYQILCRMMLKHRIIFVSGSFHHFSQLSGSSSLVLEI